MLRISQIVLALAIWANVVGCVKMTTLSQPRGEEHLKALAEGERHYRHGRLQESVDAFMHAAQSAERRVDKDEALYRCTRTLQEQKNYTQALEILHEIAERQPVSRRTARALFDAALIRDRILGEKEAAYAGYDRVIVEHSDSGLGVRALFHRLNGLADNPEDKLTYIDVMYEKVGTTTLGDDLLYAKAELLLEQEARDEAKLSLLRLVDEHPYPFGHRWDNALVRLADLEEEEKDYQAAIAYLERLVHRNEETNLVGSYTLPTFPKAQLRIARLQRDHLHDRDAADSAYRRLERKFPRSILRDDARLERALLWIDDDKRKACKLLQSVVDDFEVGHARRLALQHLQSCSD